MVDEQKELKDRIDNLYLEELSEAYIIVNNYLNNLPLKINTVNVSSSFNADLYKKECEKAKKQEEENTKFYHIERRRLQAILKEMVKEKSGLSSLNLSDNVKEKIYDYAYHLGTSFGYYGTGKYITYTILEDIVQLFKEDVETDLVFQ